MRTKEKNNNHYAWIHFSYAWIILFVAIPTLIIILFCFLNTQYIGLQYAPPYAIDNDSTVLIKIHLKNIVEVLSSPLYWHAYINSVFLALISTIGCVFVTYPLMWMAWQIPRKWKFCLLGCVLLPYVTSCMIRLYALKNLLSPQNPLTQAMLPARSGLIFEILPSDSYLALVAAMVSVYALFMAYPIYLSFIKIPKNIIEAAYDLGARPSDALKRIVFPLSLGGVETGFKIVFLATFCDCVISDFFGDDKMLLWGRIIYQTFLVERNWPKACVLAILSISVYVIPWSIFYILNHYCKNFPVEEVIEPDGL